MSTSLSDQLAPHLPYLRRYARALSGSQISGDAFVKATLQTLIEDSSVIDLKLGAKAGLFKLFHRLWNSAAPDREEDQDSASIFEKTAQQRLDAMASENRQTLLLTTLEGFSISETAYIIGKPEPIVRTLTEEAIEEIDRQTKTSVLIIEDEPMISLDLSDIVEGLGHTVSTIATTRDEATKAVSKSKPGLVLADIQLADGSSGIDAVKDILSQHDVPVIFITSFPERLLTGERPEPTFLITKPFDPNTVKAGISQALFFNSTAAIAA